jgi:hypothetical protein
VYYVSLRSILLEQSQSPGKGKHLARCADEAGHEVNTFTHMLKAAVKVLKTTAPLLLKNMANDLLHFVQNGNTMQQSIALELAAGASHYIQPLHVLGSEREMVRFCPILIRIYTYLLHLVFT